MSDLEDQLRAALSGARSDSRWDVVPRRLDVAGVRHVALVRRRRARMAVAGGVAVAVVGGVLALGSFGGHARESLQPAAPPVSASPPAPVPSISPAWRPTSARDWTLPHEQYLQFEQTHTILRPTAGPEQVASPAPLTPASAALEAQVQIVLPAGSTVRRDDAPDGEQAVPALHVTLADGTPVEVERRQLTEPQDASETLPDQQVPGLDDRYSSTDSSVGYSFPGQPDGVNAVYILDSRGRMTTWYAPRSLPLATLTEWALTADGAIRGN